MTVLKDIDRQPAQKQEAAATPSSLSGFTYRMLIALGMAAGVYVLWRIADVFVLVFAGIVLAGVFHALSDPLARHTGMRPKWALAVVMVALAAAIGATLWLTGATVAAQLGQLWTTLPDAWTKTEDWLRQSPFGSQLMDLARTSDIGGGSVGRLASFAGTTLGALTNFILILFLAIFLAIDPALYRRGLVRLAPHPVRPRLEEAMMAAGHALKRWVLGQMVAMVSVGLLTGLGLWALGMPLALSLGLVAGLLEFIPLVGPIVSAVPGLLIAFTRSPMDAFYVGLLYLAVQQVEGNVLMPIVQRWAVALPPALGILAVVIFGLLFGILGVIFATPLMVVAMVMMRKLIVEDVLENENSR